MVSKTIPRHSGRFLSRPTNGCETPTTSANAPDLAARFAGLFVLNVETFHLAPVAPVRGSDHRCHRPPDRVDLGRIHICRCAYRKLKAGHSGDGVRRGRDTI